MRGVQNQYNWLERTQRKRNTGNKQESFHHYDLVKIDREDMQIESFYKTLCLPGNSLVEMIYQYTAHQKAASKSLYGSNSIIQISIFAILSGLATPRPFITFWF
jgi:hypothetical protein